jgi:hypothetical protein
LTPEILKIPGLLGNDIEERFERRFRYPQIASELDLPFFGIERDQEHVVDGEQRPDQENETEYGRSDLGQNSPPSIARSPRRWLRDSQRDAHTRTSFV